MPAETNLLEQLVQQLDSTGQSIRSENITNVDRLKVAVCGEPKTGKSNIVARTCRKPLLVYDFDDRKESIAGLKDIVIKTLIDTADDNPLAWGVFESDIGTLEYTKTQCKKGEFPFKSILLDSATFLRKYAEHQYLKDDSGTKRANLKIGTTKYIIPRGWDAVVGVQKMMEGVLSRLFALDIDVYMTFHTRPEKDIQKSTDTNVVYKDILTVDPPNLKVLLPKFNDQWRTFVDSDGTYKVQLKPDYQFNAATVLHNVENVEQPDIQELLRKHNQNGNK
jgi:hypothetical protein